MRFRKIVPAVILGMIFCMSACKIWAGQRFIDNGDGTVTDTKLGLMWSQTDNQGDIDWKSAQRWAKYTFPLLVPSEKREGWRLPTLAELQSLYVRDKTFKGYETECGLRVKISPPIRITCGWVWSSERRSITARVYNFQRGYAYTDRMVHKRGFRALAVRPIKLGD